MATMLFAVKPTNTIVFTVVAALLGVVVLLAIYGPARRAVRVDPAVALRYK
jgi:ABC-type lipoprotein release transport system permease subunit